MRAVCYFAPNSPEPGPKNESPTQIRYATIPILDAAQVSVSRIKSDQISTAVRFAWQVHMLNPKRYRDDCMRSFGKVLPLPAQETLVDTSDQVVDDRGRKTVSTTERVDCKPNTKDFTDFDLVSAIQRQLDFCRKIIPLEKHVDRQLPVWMERYGMFLSLLRSQRAKTGKDRVVCVPTLNIDLIWHTHMLFPAQVRLCDNYTRILCTDCSCVPFLFVAIGRWRCDSTLEK